MNYIEDLGSAKALEGFEAEELEVGDPDETMGGHADLYFEEDDGMITLQLDYLKKAYREDKMQEFIRMCAKYLRQVTGIPEAGSGEP